MAENTASRPERRSHAVPRVDWERRKLIQRGLALSATTVLVGSSGFAVKGLVDTLVNIASEKDPQLKEEPTKIFEGSIQIKKENEGIPLSLRSEPILTTDKAMFPNTISWSEVTEVNGVNIKEVNEFEITNPLIVEGENADDYIADRVRGHKGQWIALKITQGNEKKYGFVSVSAQTAKHVIPDIENGKYSDIDHQKSKDSIFFTKEGKKFEPEKIGVVKTEK